MSPIRPCPYCGKSTNFHEDELEQVEIGSAVCLDCGLKIAKSAFILEVFAGEHDDLVNQINEEREDEE